MSRAFGILFWVTLLLYAFAAGAQIYGHIFRKRSWFERPRFLVLTGLVFHAILVGWRWIATGHVPTIGNFENTLFGGFFIVAMVAWAGWSGKYPLLEAGALPFALVILGGGAMSDTSARPMVASLKTFWLYIHIFFAWLAYGAYTISCGAGVAFLMKSRAGREPSPKDELDRLDELMFRSTAFGFVTDSIMIAAGAIWARDLWGAYWSWDPVETWSLISWLIYGLALHLRVTLGWKGRRLAWVLVFAIAGVLISFWGVNLVMEGTAHVFTVNTE